MKLFTPDELRILATRILRGAHVPESQAVIVAEELVGANLVGHDSHGVMRLMQYVKQIEDGMIQPEQPIEVVAQTPALVRIDAHRNFGQVAAKSALEAGMNLASVNGSASVFLGNCSHVGRMGSYTRQAAENGFACLMCVNTPGPGGVAPFGGIDRRLGTNPISLAAPGLDFPLVLDTTTSATAEGKLRVAFQKGEHVPENLMIDSQGNPSTNPADFYATPPGAILPLGGPFGFKGYGLAVMIDIFAGILSGSGVCRTDIPPGMNGVWFQLLHLDHFLPREQYRFLMEKYVAHLKSSRPAPGSPGVLLPGEIEEVRQRQRQQEGIPLPDETWRQIQELGTRLGVTL